MSGYSTAQIWIVILAMGVGTYAIRFSFLGLIGGRKLPAWVLRHLRYAPMAVIPALIAPLVLWPQATQGQPDPARLPRRRRRCWRRAAQAHAGGDLLRRRDAVRGVLADRAVRLDARTGARQVSCNAECLRKTTAWRPQHLRQRYGVARPGRVGAAIGDARGPRGAAVDRGPCRKFRAAAAVSSVGMGVDDVAVVVGVVVVNRLLDDPRQLPERLLQLHRIPGVRQRLEPRHRRAGSR